MRSCQGTEGHLETISEDVIGGERNIACVRMFCNFHSSSNIILVIKFRIVHAARMEGWQVPSVCHKAEYNLEDVSVCERIILK